MSYNGDGVRVAATSGGSTTRYAQDLVAPLSQVLNDGSSTYLYGHTCFAAVDATGTRTWAHYDALGSLRQTLDDAGTPLSPTGYAYTPVGVVCTVYRHRELRYGHREQP